MRIARRFTDAGKDLYDSIEFRRTSSEIRNPDGSVVFQASDIDVPTSWSQVACDILAQKYFRKAGVPVALKKIPEDDVPEWLWRSEADRAALRSVPAKDRHVMERDCRQVFHRLAGCWTYWAHKSGYFNTEEDAHAYYDDTLTFPGMPTVALTSGNLWCLCVR